MPRQIAYRWQQAIQCRDASASPACILHILRCPDNASMCSNYLPVTRADRLLTYFGVERDRDEPPADVFPTGLAPFIRLAQDDSGNKRIAHDGHFGLLPAFKQRELAYGRKTYNARSETVATLPSFRDAWRRGHRCIVPAEAIFEPRYFGTVEQPGKSERWRISQDGDVPMGIAGIYTGWIDPEGRQRFSFAMLTVNADGHPVFDLMHKPGDEKRMVVILAPADFDAWLTCSVAEAPKFFRRWMGPLTIQASPLVRPPRGTLGAVVPPKPPDVDPRSGELF